MMPPSGDSQFVLDLLAKSVVKVNKQGVKEETQEETGKLLTSAGVKKRKIEDSDDVKHTKKGLDVKSKVISGELKGKTTSEHKEDTIKSLVFNYLKKVSPKLAEEFLRQFTFVQCSLKLESVVDFSYDNLATSSKEKRLQQHQN